MTDVIHASGARTGRAGAGWALRDCTISLPPEGRVVGLVGPTAPPDDLLHMAVGLLEPTTGTIEVLGARPAPTADQLRRVGFVAQEAPLVRGDVRGETTCGWGAWTNPSWDAFAGRQRLGGLGLDPRRRRGSLSGGQRAQLALTLALAKRPELLILDEPVAKLDPLALREFLQSLMEASPSRASASCSRRTWWPTWSGSATTWWSLRFPRPARGEVERAGLATHHRLSGPRREPRSLPAIQGHQESHTEQQSDLLMRTDEPILDPSWAVNTVRLEDMVLAYMSPAGNEAPANSRRLKVEA